MTVRFCPFCRESFEEAAACPEHGLALVDFRALPTADPVHDDESWLPWSEFSYGRGWLLLGACLLLLAFVLPFAEMTGGFVAASSLYDLAAQRAKTLWLVPASAVAVLALFMRLRTPLALRGARLAVAWLALLPLALAAYRFSGSQDAAARLSEKGGELVVVTARSGAYVVAAGGLVLLIAAWRLGRASHKPVRVRELS